MSWRLANSLVKLRDEVHAVSPNQTVYDIGDLAHQARSSDHNPNAAGVVCAVDIMQGNGLDLQALANYLVAHPHPDAKYVIHNRRIASKSQGWVWRAYTGSDPHTNHIHVSVGVGSDGHSTQPYDDTVAWNVARAIGGPVIVPVSNPTPAGRPELRKGAKGTWVYFVQALLEAHGHKPAGGLDGDFGDGTEAAVKAFQASAGIGRDGVVGPVTWSRLVGSEPELRRGANGLAVRIVQALLIVHGCAPAGGTDGDFGPGTEAAVRKFQSFKKIGVDGVVGPQTYGWLIPAHA